MRDNTATRVDNPDPPAPFVAPPPRLSLSTVVTVNLGVTGSAVAGDDYTVLPATVTIPAGESRTAVDIVPLPGVSPGLLREHW